ncbi:MAG: hypothetical protein MHM6MM_003196 [Cercozoa sp. M6MM]
MSFGFGALAMLFFGEYLLYPTSSAFPQKDEYLAFIVPLILIVARTGIVLTVMWSLYATSERCPCVVTSSSCALFVGLASACPLLMLLLWKKLHLSTVLVGASMLFVSLVLFAVVWVLHARYWQQHTQRTAAKFTAGVGSVHVQPFTWHAWLSALLFGFAPIPCFDPLSGLSNKNGNDRAGDETSDETSDMFEQHHILRALFVTRGIFLAAGIWFTTRGLADILIGDTDSNKSFGRQFFYQLFAAAISEEFGKLCAAASVLACLRYRRLPLALPMAAMLCGAIFGIYENYTYLRLERITGFAPCR